MTYRHRRSWFFFAAILLFSSIGFFIAFSLTPPPRPGADNGLGLPTLQQDCLVRGIAFGILGLLIAFYLYFRRVVIDDAEVRIYGMLNICLFRARWSEVTKLTLANDYNGASSLRSWTLESLTSRGRVPRTLDRYPEMMRAIALRIPAKARPITAPSFPPGNPTEVLEITHRGGSLRSQILSVGAALWVINALFTTCALGIVTPTTGVPTDAAFVVVFLISTALMPLPFFIDALATWRRSSSVTPRGIQEDDLQGSREVRWEDIVFAEVRRSLTPLGMTTELVVASPFAAITIDKSERTYRAALEAFYLAPPTAILIPPLGGPQ
jgi:hypothetical protein